MTDEGQMKTNQQIRFNIIRLFHILRGLFQGALGHRTFGFVFDWFFPQHFGVIQKCLQVYIEDDEVVYLIFKFLNELLDNQSNRLRFDTWNVNGLIIFKETANFMINYLDLYKCFKAKAVKQDRYKEIYKFLKILMSMLGKCISGGYINFAICDFYNDNSFV